MKYNKKEEHLQIMSFQNMRKSSNFVSLSMILLRDQNSIKTREKLKKKAKDFHFKIEM